MTLEHRCVGALTKMPPAPYAYTGAISPYECALISSRTTFFGLLVGEVEVAFRRVTYRVKGLYLAATVDKRAREFAQELMRSAADREWLEKTGLMAVYPVGHPKRLALELQAIMERKVIPWSNR